MVEINLVAYFDVDKDGREEAIVRASSCATGTAGPDILGVYKLLSSGEIEEIRIIDKNQNFTKEEIYKPFEGDNVNSTLWIKNGQLVTHIYDKFGGKTRDLVYQWNAKEFVLQSVGKVDYSTKRR